MRAVLLFTLPLVFCIAAFAQYPGGTSVFRMLSQPASARLTGLGGNQIAVIDGDIQLLGSNPAMLNPSMGGRLAWNHFLLPGSIHSGRANWALKSPGEKLQFQLALQFIRYGEMPRTDAFFQESGTFRAGESRLSAGFAQSIHPRLRWGTTISLAQSTLGEFASTALVLDGGMCYSDTSGRTTVAIVLRNAGIQAIPFAPEIGREPIAGDLQVGFSRRLRYLPFRYSLIYSNLQRWNVRYAYPDKEPVALLIGEEWTGPGVAAIFLDNLFRHILLNGELLIGARENLSLRMAYNHRIRREMGVPGVGGLHGFSFGIGIRTPRFAFDFGRSMYHLGGGLTHFGISTSGKKTIF